jgi:hypothetical protein
MDPLAASIEARELAAARTRQWALEHAPDALEGGEPEPPEDNFEAGPGHEAAAESKAGTHTALKAAAGAGAEAARLAGGTAAAGEFEAGAGGDAGGYVAAGELEGGVGRDAGGHAAAGAAGLPTPIPTTLGKSDSLPQATAPHTHAPVPPPPKSPPAVTTATASKRGVGYWGSAEVGLAPAAPPAQKCTGGGLQRQQGQEQQQTQVQQQQQQRVRAMQQQQQQQGRARQLPPPQQQQQRSALLSTVLPLPFSDTIPPLSGTSPRSHPSHTLARLDLECVGKHPQACHKQDQQVWSACMQACAHVRTLTRTHAHINVRIHVHQPQHTHTHVH